jgi:hypothetical protein
VASVVKGFGVVVSMEEKGCVDMVLSPGGGFVGFG